MISRKLILLLVYALVLPLGFLTLGTGYGFSSDEVSSEQNASLDQALAGFFESNFRDAIVQSPDEYVVAVVVVTDDSECLSENIETCNMNVSIRDLIACRLTKQMRLGDNLTMQIVAPPAQSSMRGERFLALAVPVSGDSFVWKTAVSDPAAEDISASRQAMATILGG